MPSLMLIFFAMVGGVFCLASFVTGDMASRQQRKKGVEGKFTHCQPLPPYQLYIYNVLILNFHTRKILVFGRGGDGGERQRQKDICIENITAFDGCLRIIIGFHQHGFWMGTFYENFINQNPSP